MALTWTFDRSGSITGMHSAPVDGQDVYAFVYKSEGGDYVAGFCRNDDCAGGHIEYCATLAKAKACCLAAVEDGTVGYYLL